MNIHFIQHNILSRKLLLFFVLLIGAWVGVRGQNISIAGPNEPDENGLFKSKAVTAFDYNTMEGTLTLQCFVTGKMIQTGTPVDLVLVLDFSTSLGKDNFNSLKAASKSVTSIVSKNSDSNIAIVAFAGGDDAKCTHNITNGFVNAKSKESEIQNELNKYTFEGKGASSYVAYNGGKISDGTKIHKGIEVAKKWVNAHTGTNDVYVIVFTDGEPGGGSGYLEVAGKAINNAYEIKQKNAKVYTVGMITESKEKTKIPLANNSNFSNISMKEYLERMSSLYPEAKLNTSGSDDRLTYSTSNWGKNNPDGVSYYQRIDENQIVSFFTTLAGDIVPQSNTNLSIQSAIVDQLVSYVNFPEDFEPSDVKCYSAPCVNVNGNQYSFGSTSSESATVVKKDGKTVSISGFDYKANCCLLNGSTPQGKKLIIEIPFVVSDPTAVTNPMNTNTSNSGIYPDKDKEDHEEVLAEFEIPIVSFVDLVIHKSGLHNGESAIFKIEKVGDSAFKPYTISLTGTSDSGTQVSATIPSQDPEGSYMVTELTGWSWTYTPSGSTSLTKGKSDVADKKLTFDFSNSKKAITTLNAEKQIRNDFRQ